VAKKILITNTVALNGGDAAILESVMHLLRVAFGDDTEFIVYDSSPEVAARYYPGIHFRKLIYFRAVPESRIGPIRSLGKRWNLGRIRLAMKCWNSWRSLAHCLLTDEERKDFYHFNSADLIVSTGGTYLVVHYSLTPRIFDYQLCLALGRPLVFFTQSLGPFKNQTFTTRKKLRNIFSYAQLILLRDKRSLENLEELDLPDVKTQISSDAVFALADPAILEQAKVSQLLNQRIKIAISVRDWRRFTTVSRQEGMQKYKEAMQALTAHLVKQRDAEIVFISTCQGIPEYQFDDSVVAREIFHNLPDEVKSHVQVDAGFHTPRALIARLREFDLAIGTRMHFCILSLLAGTPVFPIAYEFKTDELFSRLGLGEWVQDIETMEPAKLLKAFDGFLKTIPSIRESLFHNVELERQCALQSGMAVKTALENLTQASREK
jgi:colanic acid/amylovoran biosynthesis protein